MKQTSEYDLYEAVLEKDDDGYPTDGALAAIREWPCDRGHSLLMAIKSAWHWPDRASRRECDNTNVDSRYTEFLFSTGGWSGNEALIDALQSNSAVWFMHWWSSRRGGHYEFRVQSHER